MYRPVFFLLSALIFGCGDSSPQRSQVDSEIVVAESDGPLPAGDSASVPPIPKNDQPDLSLPPSPDSSPPPEEPASVYPPIDEGETQGRVARRREPPSVQTMAKYGFRRLESQRLILITDSNDPSLDEIPPLADRLFDELETWFGGLPEADDGRDFQVVGYIMVDRNRFREAGLMPEESFTILHGRHQGYTFWTGFPDTDYYRRHLALHEFIHCYMTCENRLQDWPPPWYIEGMAEFFATHRLGSETSKPEFGVMPAQPEGFEGWGRIRALRLAFEDADHNFIPVPDYPFFEQVTPRTSRPFETTTQYAGSWAACWFLAHHPQAMSAMEALAKKRTFPFFQIEWERQRDSFGQRLPTDWLLFTEQLDFGFDPERCFPVHSEDDRTTPNRLATSNPPSTYSLTLQADRGWQETGIRIDANQTVQLNCEGRCVVNETDVPWESTADGISIDYYRGHRVGKVIAVVVSEDAETMTDRLPVGTSASITSPFKGSLWLMVNDACDSRSNNRGEYQVTIEASQ